ncbi:hypothetical protein PR003_g16989 [Phytophthora rubi]|uniref:Uncharacterized protein n=1 Tax=Phytophthora rubi TaxID=129364 RepID=A0A6A4EG53_9STRA|nr:hypothetical protein PR003_g16989 [Phytophthora rubi]
MPLDDTAEDATEDGGPTRMGFERNKNGVIKLTPTQLSRKERKQQALDMYYDTVQEDDKLTSIRTLFKEHKKKQRRITTVPNFMSGSPMIPYGYNDLHVSILYLDMPHLPSQP